MECLAEFGVDGGVEAVEGTSDPCRGRRRRVGELGETAVQQPVVDAGEERGVGQSGVGDAVAVGAGDAPDQPVCA